MTLEFALSRASKTMLSFTFAISGMVGCGGASPQTADVPDSRIEFDQVAVDIDEQAQRELDESAVTKVREVGE